MFRNTSHTYEHIQRPSHPYRSFLSFPCGIADYAIFLTDQEELKGAEALIKELTKVFKANKPEDLRRDGAFYLDVKTLMPGGDAGECVLMPRVIIPKSGWRCVGARILSLSFPLSHPWI